MRGVIALVESLTIGMKSLGISANAQLDEPDEEITGTTWGVAVAISLIFAIGLFFVLPVTVASFWKDQLGNSVFFVLVEKAIRITIFLGYIWAISHIKDLRRVFEYHGAEHKTISCYEANDELVPERASLYSRLHMRCGTSFLLIVMVIAVFVFAPIGRPALHWLILSRIVGIALVAGLAYEVIRWAGPQPRQALGAGPHVARPAAAEADHARALAGPARGRDRRAQVGARGREPTSLDRRGQARHGSRRLRAMADASVTDRLVEQIEQRYRELEEQLADPDTISDRNRYAEVSKEYGDLGEPHELAEQYKQAQSDSRMLDDEDGDLDPEDRREFQEMVSAARARDWSSSVRSSALRWWSAIRTTRRT